MIKKSREIRRNEGLRTLTHNGKEIPYFMHVPGIDMDLIKRVQNGEVRKLDVNNAVKEYLDFTQLLMRALLEFDAEKVNNIQKMQEAFANKAMKAFQRMLEEDQQDFRTRLSGTPRKSRR